MLTPKQIKDARHRAGLTQEALGAMVGVSHRTIGNWERGGTSPQAHEHKLRSALGEHLEESDGAPAPSLRGASDVELLAEIARRFSRTAHEDRRAGDEGADSTPAIGADDKELARLYPVPDVEDAAASTDVAEMQARERDWAERGEESQVQDDD